MKWLGSQNRLEKLFSISLLTGDPLFPPSSVRLRNGLPDGVKGVFGVVAENE